MNANSQATRLVDLEAARADSILEVQDLKVHFPIRGGVLKKQVGSVKAVDGVDLEIRRGEILGLVGESGCGKSTLGKAVLRLIESTEGSLTYRGDQGSVDLNELPERDLNELRSELQIIFQDPYSSLNPSITIFESLRKGLTKFGPKNKAEQRELLGDLFEKVNLRRDHLDRYPNEFSGGQRQRIAIVRALSVDPEFIVCDEAVSALDVSVQAQVLDLLKDLRQERDLTYLFISHNLSVVEYIADRIAVMYLGRIVEVAEADELYRNPQHPYTKALLSAIPVTDLDRVSTRVVLQGDVPSPANPPSGCPFHPRCPIAIDECKVKVPHLRDISGAGPEHSVSCNLV